MGRNKYPAIIAHVPYELREALEQHAITSKSTMTKIVIDALSNFLKQQEKKDIGL